MGSALAKATDWATVTAWAAWATVAVYVVLGIFAWIQVLQARRLREEQARPFVIVDFEPGFLVYLTVENIGRTMARDVSIRFDKPLESTLSGPPRLHSSRDTVSAAVMGPLPAPGKLEQWPGGR